MANPESSPRRTTVAIVEKSSGALLRYELLEPTNSQAEGESEYFDRFVDEELPQMRKGEARFYFLYSRTEGLRPDVREVGIINKPVRWERKVMGHPGPGASGELPYQVEWGDPKAVKKGAFPRPPGADPSAVIEDGGIDEEAIIGAAQRVHSLIRNAVADKFSESTRGELLDGLGDLMRSTGTSGEPSEYWYMCESMEATAVDLYDSAILLWLESDAANALPSGLKEGYNERMEGDPERPDELSAIARSITQGGLL